MLEVIEDMYKRQAYNCAKSTSKNRSSAKTEQEAQIIDMVSEYQASRRISNEGKEKAA